MSKTRDTGFLGNVVKVDSTGNVSFVSGSTTLMSISSSGAVTTTGVISGSNALTSSYSQNSELLDNLDSTSFVFTSSFNTYSSSMSTRVSNNESTGSTLTSASASLNTASGSFSTRVTRIEGNYATTGSNVFLGAQTVCANITSTGTIIAQTLNVQQVTSSVVYSSGSNIFGCSLSNTQQFTGSVLMTGSLTVTTTGTSPEFQVVAGGTIKGNALTDVHQVTGSLTVTGSNALFNVGCVGIGTTSPEKIVDVFTSGADPATCVQIRASRTAYGSVRYNLITYAGGSTSTDRFTIQNNAGTNVLNILGNGNVGIGCTTPGTSLSIESSGVSSLIKSLATVDSVTYGNFQMYRQACKIGNGVGIALGLINSAGTNAEYSYIGTIIESCTNLQECGALAFYTTTAGNGRCERIRLTSAGNVGIGIQDPNSYSAVLTVAGNIRASLGCAIGVWDSSNTTYVQFSSPSSRNLRITNDGGTEYFRLSNPGIACFNGAVCASAARIGSNSTSLGSNALLSVGSSGYGAFGVLAYGQGVGTWDSGISINQGNAGMAMLVLASQHTSSGTSTQSALYLVNFYYDGNNTPAATFIAGTNFVTFGKSGSNTLTLTTSGIALVQYSLIGNK